MLWKEKDRSRIRNVQIDNLRGLLGIRRMDRVPNARIRALCGVTKEVDERIGVCVLQWFGHLERMEKDGISNRVYVGVCAGSRSLGRLRKKWIDTVKDCLRKTGLDVTQAKRMVQDRSERRGFVRGECMGHSPGDELQTLARCHSCELPQLYEACGCKSGCGRAYNLKSIKGIVFLHFLKL